MKCFKWDLGVFAREELSGLEGIIKSRADYLTGCNRYAIQQKGLDKNGKPYEWVWFDEEEIDSINKKGKTQNTANKKFGGPRPANQNAPTR